MPTVLDVRSAHRAGLGTFSQFRPFNSFPFFLTCIFLVVDSVSKSCLSSTRPKPAAAPLPPRFWSAFQPRQAHVQLLHLSPSRTQNLEFPRNNRCKSFLPDICRVRGILPLTFPTPGRDFVRDAGLSGITRQIIVCGISCLSRPTTAPTAYFFRRLRLPMTQQSVFPR